MADVRKKNQAPTVSYTRTMPEIDALMQIWPQEIEDAIHNLFLPSAELDLSLEDFSRIACCLMDVPIHHQNKEKNLIESLHVLFTLYSTFK